MILRLQKYDLSVSYRAGKLLYVADTLSRAYIQEPLTLQPLTGEVWSITKFEEVNALKNISIAPYRLAEIKEAREHDGELQKLKDVVQHGWPDSKKEVNREVQPYFNM